MTVADLLNDRSDPARIVALVMGRPVTLVQFRRDVADHAVKMRMRGCQRGLLVTQETYWAAVGLMALFQAGATAVIPPNMLPETLRRLRSEWDCVISDTELADDSDCIRLRSAVEAPSGLSALNATACHIELYTSGTTGDPLRVRKTLRQMEIEAADIEALFGRHLASGAQVCGTVTHQHMYGLAYRLFWPLCSRRPFDSTVHGFWEHLLQTDLAGSAVVSGPAHLSRLSGIPPLPDASRPGLVMSAGAPLPKGAATANADVLGAPLVEIYGSTETNSIAWREVATPDLPWSPFPGIAVDRLADGRIALRSPYVDGDGRYEGQDLIDLTNDGRFMLLGRADRLVKIEGKRVSLSEVERHLRANPAVAAAAAVTLPGETLTLAAVVVPSPEGSARLGELGNFRFGRWLRQELADRLEPAGLPRRWRFVEALPQSGLGKISAAALRGLFADPVENTSATGPSEPDSRLLVRGPDWVELELFNRPDLRQLQGHFPGLPIVPGVAQIDWAVKLAARHLALPLEVASGYQVKFHRLTLPDTLVVLRLEHDKVRSRLSFSYRRMDQEMLTSGSISLVAT